jgi:murein DD-endopeptidase MepM/ murein hydrolase activator NlpD
MVSVPQSRATPMPRSRARLRSAVVPAVAMLLVGSGVALASTAAATPSAKKTIAGSYQMPFPCGQAWTGSTRSSHSPSSKAIDWNRPDDDGDDVVSSGPGTVTVANKTGKTGYGRYVQVTHAGGESTLYGHLSSVVVDVGATVDQGTLLGYVGTTGNSTGPHLHYEQRLGSTVEDAIFGGVKFAYGSTQTSANCVDVPLAANMIGGAAAELVVFRRALRSTFQVQRPGAAPVVITFGKGTDEPLLGDWDGDGIANVAVRRPAESAFYLATPGGTQKIPYGIPTDKPVAGDWDGDGRAEVGVRRPSTASFYLRAADGTQTDIVIGDANDLPVTGDWNGDRRTDVGVYDVATATFTLRFVGVSGVPWTATVAFGQAGDLPVPGDWDGNGFTDLGGWRPGSATFLNRQAPSLTADARTVTSVRFGRPRR